MTIMFQPGSWERHRLPWQRVSVGVGGCLHPPRPPDRERLLLEGHSQPAAAAGAGGETQPRLRGGGIDSKGSGKISVCLPRAEGEPPRGQGKEPSYSPPSAPVTDFCLPLWYLIDYKLTRNPQGAPSLCWGSRSVGKLSESEDFVAEMYSEWPRSGRLCDARQHTLDDSWKSGMEKTY